MAKKVAVVYWSGTGNTEIMAKAIAEGIQAAGAEAELMGPSDFGPDKMNAYGAFAFGCPAMGAEELEETEFAPMFDSIEGSLAGKQVLLFGSYGWGDGEWMRAWADRTKGAGAFLVEDQGFMINNTPDADGEEQCREMGKKLA